MDDVELRWWLHAPGGTAPQSLMRYLDTGPEKRKVPT